VPSLRAEGTVVGQSPAGGTTAQLGTLVTLQVSSGKAPTIAVPNVVGQEATAARATLEGAGYVVKVVTQEIGDPKKDGIVLSMDPAAGAKVDKGSTITITVGAKKH
jgi:serine/threonine-protein kinase